MPPLHVCCHPCDFKAGRLTDPLMDAAPSCWVRAAHLRTLTRPRWKVWLSNAESENEPLCFIASSPQRKSSVVTRRQQRSESETTHLATAAVLQAQAPPHLVVAAGGVEGVGAAGEQRLVVARHQHFDVVVTFVLLRGKHTSRTAVNESRTHTHTHLSQSRGTLSGLLTARLTSAYPFCADEDLEISCP